MGHRQYIREGIFSIEYVFKLIRDAKLAGKNTIIVNNRLVYVRSGRYQTFMEKGIVCVRCGLKATHFALERSRSMDDTIFFHFNLYGKLESGGERLFTKDHIMPRCSGGIEHISNFQTMCTRCNCKKSDTLPSKHLRKELTKNGKMPTAQQPQFNISQP